MLTAALCTLVALSTAQTAPATGSVTTVTATAAPRLQDPSSIDVEVTNSGTKTAVAWSLEIVETLPDGRKESIGHDQDFYTVLVYPVTNPVSTPAVGPIASGKTMKVLSLPLGNAVAVEAFVRAVVFADRTAEGDGARLKSIFARRDTEARSWQALSTSLRQTSTQPTMMRQRLQHLADDLDASPTPVESPAARKLVSTNVKLLLQRYTQDSAELQQAFQQLSTMIDTYAQGAAEQSRPRY